MCSIYLMNRPGLVFQVIDPPDPGRLGGHYFHACCPYVSVLHHIKKQTQAAALKQNTLQSYMEPGGSLNSLNL